MTQKQIQELFGVPSATLKDWKNDPTNKKHNLGLLLASLDYEESKKEIEELRNNSHYSIKRRKKKKLGDKGRKLDIIDGNRL